MILQNVTVAILGRTSTGSLCVKRIVTNPTVPSLNGCPVYGHYCRRVLSVAEVMKSARSYGDAVSKNQAQLKRLNNTLECLADFPGQVPLEAVLVPVSTCSVNEVSCSAA